MFKELKIYYLYTMYSFQRSFGHPFQLLIFVIGKTLRIGLFLLFLYFLLGKAKTLGGYSKEQIIVFYLSFNIIDTLAQLLFREVYRFRDILISGNLDFLLLKPTNALNRLLLGGADLFDALFLAILCIFTYVYIYNNLVFDWVDFLGYTILLVNGVVIAASMHIAILGVGVLTTSIDRLMMFYRDLSSMLRIPVDLYIEPIRSLLTFAIPMGIMMTFPPKALMGFLGFWDIVLYVIFGVIVLFISVVFWRYSLRFYVGSGG